MSDRNGALTIGHHLATLLHHDGQGLRQLVVGSTPTVPSTSSASRDSKETTSPHFRNEFLVRVDTYIQHVSRFAKIPSPFNFFYYSHCMPYTFANCLCSVPPPLHNPVHLNCLLTLEKQANRCCFFNPSGFYCSPAAAQYVQIQTAKCRREIKAIFSKLILLPGKNKNIHL